MGDKNSFLSTLERALAPTGGKSIGTAESGFFSRWGWNNGDNWSAMPISADIALTHDTVWACVKLISETVSTLPVGFFKRTANGGRELATDHSLYEILHNQPNARMTAVNFWQAVSASLLLWGNAYVEIQRNGKVIVALDFLLPQFVQVSRGSTGFLEYRYTDPRRRNEQRDIAAGNMMHIRSFSLDGECGLSAIQYGRNSIAGALTKNKASDETFRDATRATGIVTMDAQLGDKQRESIRANVKAVAEEGGVYVLEKGAGYEPLRFSPIDAELLNSQSFSVETICRWFRTPPVMIGHGDKASSWPTSTEAQGALFVRYVLRACVLGIEQEIRRSLLSPAERLSYFAELSLEGLLRGDSAARSSFYSTALQNGWMTRNEVRRLENLPLVDGGNVLTVQSNLISLDQLGKVPVANNVQDALKSWLGIEEKPHES